MILRCIYRQRGNRVVKSVCAGVKVKVHALTSHRRKDGFIFSRVLPARARGCCLVLITVRCPDQGYKSSFKLRRISCCLSLLYIYYSSSVSSHIHIFPLLLLSNPKSTAAPCLFSHQTIPLSHECNHRFLHLFATEFTTNSRLIVQ